MKKQFLNLGKALNKAEQKKINGGGYQCTTADSCPPGECCSVGTCRPNDGVTQCEQMPEEGGGGNPGDDATPGSLFWCTLHLNDPLCSDFEWLRP